MLTLGRETSGVTEGERVRFKIYSDRPVTRSTNVKVYRQERGNFGISTGTSSVGISAGDGPWSFSYSTTDDSTDESDGSVQASLRYGSYYTPGSPSSASVAIRDNDDPPAVISTVSISGGRAVTEGENVVFTLTATPKPTEAISVKVHIADPYNDDPGITIFLTDYSERTVRIGTSGRATLSLATDDDQEDERDDDVVATIKPSASEYRIGTASASVRVRDNDAPATPRAQVGSYGSVAAGNKLSAWVGFCDNDNPNNAQLPNSVRVKIERPGYTTKYIWVTMSRTSGCWKYGTIQENTYRAGTAYITVMSGTGYTSGDRISIRIS